MKKKTSRNIKIAIVVLMVLMAAYVFLKPKAGSPLDGVALDVFAVRPETVQKRDLKHQLLMSGSIKAWEEATLYPRVEGKLLKNLLREGDAVKKNQTVSLIERDEVGAVYEPVVVPSTLTGVIGRVYLDPGANVTISTIGEIYKGQPATLRIDALPGKEFNARLQIISPVVDANSRAVAVEFWADNPKGLLKSGMFAKVDITLSEKKDAVSIAKKSLYRQEGETFVFVPSADGKTAQKKPVTVGFENTDYLEIADGLKEGDVILEFAYGLQDGSKIDLGK